LADPFLGLLGIPLVRLAAVLLLMRVLELLQGLQQLARLKPVMVLVHQWGILFRNYVVRRLGVLDLLLMTLQ
jgi:hypothetical protein